VVSELRKITLYLNGKPGPDAQWEVRADGLGLGFVHEAYVEELVNRAAGETGRVCRSVDCPDPDPHIHY